MKKLSLLLSAGLFAGILASCGAKYTPLTEEQKTAKADSIFAATSADIKAEKEKACESGMQAAVDAKVAELSQEATAAN